MRPLRIISLAAVSVALLAGTAASVVAQDEASDPMAPAYFTMVEETMDGLVTTDPRFSGTWIANDPVQYPVAILHGPEHVYAGPVHLRNDEGAWVGWTSGFSWNGEVPWHEQMWFAGEGAYEDLGAVVVGACCDAEDQMTLEGVIFHQGDVPAMWEAPAV